MWIITFPDKKEMTNYYNKYFNKIGSKMEVTIPRVIPQITRSNLLIKELMFVAPITINEVVEHMFSLNNSAPDNDDITPNLIKSCHQNI